MSTLQRRPGPSELDPQGHQRRRRTIEMSLAIGFPVGLVLLWQLAATTGWIDGRLYPAPTDIISYAQTMYTQQNLMVDTWASARRVLIGFAYGSIAGVLLGILMGTSRLVRVTLDATLTGLYTVPKLAILPVFLMILGFGEAPVIAVLGVTVFFFVWISTMSAVQAVPDTYIKASVSFDASRWQTFRHVILPAALPQIFVGLRIAAGVAVLTLIGVEFVFAPSNQGIGYITNLGRQLGVPKQAYVGVVIAALMGVVLTWIVRLAGRLATPWAPEGSAEGPK